MCIQIVLCPACQPFAACTQLKAGDADAAKTNMAVEKEDPDYKPPADA